RFKSGLFSIKASSLYYIVILSTQMAKIRSKIAFFRHIIFANIAAGNMTLRKMPKASKIRQHGVR
ncbi:MAG: hypothetical protein WC637_21140, partial [Victivallales bacterium]